MKRCAQLAVVAITMVGSPMVGQQGEAFAPFAPRAYRLVNGVAFSPDDQVMYFALYYREVLAHRGMPSDAAPETGLFRAARNGEAWSEPQLLAFSGAFEDYEPALTADGTLMVFNSRRPYADGRLPERNDLWMAERGVDGWQAPTRIQAITSFEHEESYGTLTADRRLVFLRGRPDRSGQVSYDLYESQFEDGAFSESTRHPVSTDRWGEGDPWIAPDGSYLIFTRWDDAIGWRETVDLYISFLASGQWTTPEALDELNTAGPDFGPAVSSDGRELYYFADGRFRRIPLAPILVRHRSN